jgi:hypothetical protein
MGRKGAATATTAPVTFTFDEKGKIPLGRRECLPLVIGSEFDGYRLSQNPGVGQKVRPDRNILGSEQNRREGRK